MNLSRSVRNDDYNQVFQHLNIDNIEKRLAKVEHSTQQPNKSAKMRVILLVFIVLKMDISAKTVIVETRAQVNLIIDIITHRISTSTDKMRTNLDKARAKTTKYQTNLLSRNMINKINKERRRSMNATPTRLSNKTQWQRAQADPNKKDRHKAEHGHVNH
jgi:hypothetical protein